jgi:hypothetical protein
MAQKVKVASAQFKKEGEGKFGRWYLYEIKVEGDDKTYQYMAKSNPQNKFVVGQDVDVEVEKKENNGYTNWSIKPVQQGGGFGGGGGSNPARMELDRKIAALNCATLMVVHGKIGAESLRGAYEKYMNEYL